MKLKKISISPVKGEEGSAMIAVLVVLLLLTLIGVAATSKSATQLLIVGAMRNHDVAIESAEAGMLYVLADRKDLYGDASVSGVAVPYNSADAGLPPTLRFDGTITYREGTDASGKVLRGTGQSHGKFTMHLYEFNSTGMAARAKRESTAVVSALGYRLGF